MSAEQAGRDRPADRVAPGRRLQRAAVLGAAAGSGLLLVTGGRPWATARVTPVAGAVYEIAAKGSDTAGAVVPFALVGLAAAAVLLLAGGLVRVVAGTLCGVAGAGALYVTGRVVADPPADTLAGVLARAASGLLSAGEPARTVWPWVALLAAAAVTASGVLGVVAARLVGPAPRRGTRPVAAPPGRPVAAGDRDGALDAWDALSRGEDPT